MSGCPFPYQRADPAPGINGAGVPGLDLDYFNYEALAKGYAIPAVRTGRPTELAVALKEAFAAADGPHMIVVDVRPGVRLEH